ncbi:MAG: hypothetical protein RL417_1904 [Pseudomonadota bacterium]|jgi:ABC-type polysaccharide/polyol phosphate export permease
MSFVAAVSAPFDLLTDLGSSTIKYREYLKQSVARDLRRAYKRSSLGYLWSMLNPLFMMLILATVFSRIMRIQVEYYSVFLLAGLLPWQYFQQTVQGGIGAIRANHRILDHIPIPKYVFILSLACSNLVNLTLALVPFLLVSLFVGKGLSLALLALPIMIVPLFLMTIGATLFFAVLNVFFDDIRHLIQIGLQALYFLTPIIYSKEHLPDSVASWLPFNPMYYIVELMRAPMYHGELPSLELLGVSIGISVGILLLGLATLRRADPKLMYFI